MKAINNINEILIRRRKLVYVKANNKNDVKEKHILALQSDIAQFGFFLSPEVINVLKTQKLDDLKGFHLSTVRALKELLGQNAMYRPLFINFPFDIPDNYDYDTQLSLFSKRFYDGVNESIPLSCGHIIFTDANKGLCPICGAINTEASVLLRSKLKEYTPLKMLDLTDKETILEVFENLLSSPVSLSDSDYEDIAVIMDEKSKKWKEHIPVITNKEILAYFLKMFLEKNREEAEIYIKTLKLTATDVLRFYAALSDSSVSLNLQIKFSSLSNKDRRLLLSMLESVENPEIDMARYPNSWKKAGERLHPGSYKNKFPKTYNAFTIIRENPKSIRSFNGQLDVFVKNNNFDDALKLLTTRPGEFLRKLDFILRNSSDSEKVISNLKNVIDKMSTTTLLSVMAHFKNRTKAPAIKYFMPKGQMAKMYVLKEPKFINIDDSVVSNVISVIQTELKSRLNRYDNVYINPELSTCLVPTVRRNATKSLHTLGRGSVIKMDDEHKRNIRFFIYWKGLVDLDLAAVFLDKDMQHKGEICYYNLNNEYGVHSGDILSAPKGASEYVDINIDSLKSNGIKYVVMQVTSFSGQNYADFDSFAGFMKREDLNSGEIYEEKTVKHRFEFDGQGTVAIPIILDLEQETVIFTDLMLNSARFSNPASTMKNTSILVQAIFDFVNSKPNLFDLFSFLSKTVDTEFDADKEYDAIFDFDRGISPYDTDIILGDILSS